MSGNEQKRGDAEALLPCPFCGGEPHVTEALGEVWVRCSQRSSSHGLSTADKAKAVAAWNRRPSGWISVKDRLPEMPDDDWKALTVLVALDNKAVSVARFGFFCSVSQILSGSKPEWRIRHRLPKRTVTHWQPLPQPPEE